MRGVGTKNIKLIVLAGRVQVNVNTQQTVGPCRWSVPCRHVAM
jgi:hypothetical protein